MSTSFHLDVWPTVFCRSYMSGMFTTGKSLVLSFSYVHLEEVPLRLSSSFLSSFVFNFFFLGQKRYHNRPIIEFELAAKEQMKITELRISKLFTANATSASTTKTPHNADVVTKARDFPVNSFSPTILCVIFKWSDDLCLTAEDCMNVIGGHLTTAKEPPEAEPSRAFTRTRPPITTHILDVARDTPASGVDVHLEMWADKQSRPLFGEVDSGCWKLEGRSSTDRDGRSGQFDEHGGRSKAWDISD
ncbi:hypothetical protein SASPL_102796 [Salvia splendens]|uniref:Transthyretin/hydroxyisourate hydrolase domain-containing protein n=1 Tax=Salvia splendens TaxID=180675 RepID=A0A8X8YWU7_SALSN|nr:hypothetical protein SASPL_102796 [Salvia splendens]